jgi:hypothetical protein
VQFLGEALPPGGDDHGAAVPDPTAALAGVAIRSVGGHHTQPKPDPNSGFPLGEVV